MRLAEVVLVKDGQLPLPDAFARPLGLYNGSKLYLSKVKGHEQHQILTTIPQDCWRRILRVSVLLEHKPGALDVVARAISDLGASILVMEGYGREPDEEGWWSGVVQLPISESEAPVAALSTNKRGIIQKLYSIYETHEGDEFPFPKRLRPEDDGPRVETFDYGLRTLDGEPVVLVENMRLTLIADQVGEPVGRYFEEKSRSITVGKSIAIEARFVWGLLMCNTEERFLRFISIRSPVEISLQIVSTSEDKTKVGVGVLPNITKILESVETEEGQGINIAYLFNYITERKLCSPAEGDDREEDRPPFKESSVIQLFLESPPSWLVDPENSKAEIEMRWRDVFERLADARIGGRRIVEWEGSRMTLWYGQKLTYVLDKRGEARPEGWWLRIRRKSGGSVRVLFGLAGLLAVLTVGACLVSWTVASVLGGFASFFLAWGGILTTKRSRRGSG
ncbi:MAG: hypothetical protein ACOC92_00955 [bacterium]